MSARQLYVAARQGDSGQVAALLGSGMDPNTRMSLEAGFVQPCFFVAAVNMHTDTLRVFWDHGANLHTPDSDGETLLRVLDKMGLRDMLHTVTLMSQQPDSDRRAAPDSKDWRQLLAQAIAQENQPPAAAAQALPEPVLERGWHSSAQGTAALREIGERLAMMQREREALAEQDARLTTEMASLIGQLMLLARLA